MGMSSCQKEVIALLEVTYTKCWGRWICHHTTLRRRSAIRPGHGKALVVVETELTRREASPRCQRTSTSASSRHSWGGQTLQYIRLHLS
jgi:hypothetical protein